MPKHPDATGYLNDLAKENGESWFKMVCDLAILSGVSVLDQQTLEILFALYTEKASYIEIKPAAVPAVPAVPAAAPPADTLEQLSGFGNFKLLGNALEVSFKKRVTLIFGANGSGKSSLCESLKVLATPVQPIRPLENVRAAGAASPTFCFKFKNDAAKQTWTPAVGYGPRRATVKFFDTAIAIQNVTNAVEPGRVIILAPFKLHVFEWAKALTTKFRTALQQAQQDNLAKLIVALTAIRTDFVKFKGRPLAVMDEKTVAGLLAEIKIGEEFADQKLLGEKQTAAAELEKATSEEGLKLLRAEHRELESFLNSLNALLTNAAEFWVLDPASKAKTLTAKQAAQEVLAKALIPKDVTLDSLLGLLRAAAPICKMDDATGHACPLCKRDLGASEIELFKQYHGLIVGVLETDITAIKSDVAKARELATAIGQVDRKAWDKCKTISEEILAAAKTGAELVVASCDLSKEPTAEAKASLESLKTSVVTWATQLASKKTAIDAAAKGREELVKQLAKLRGEIEPLEYAQAIADRLAKLKEAQQMVVESQDWNNKLPAFTQVLKKITEKAKDAHEDLVVADFETRLNAEYIALAEKNMAAFGVKLARKGADAAVSVLPQVGGRGIHDVLSEGEQRLHALALFFAELETCQQSVVVFDDPVSSFDYNYIENYCIRLRNHVLNHATRQLIVLTHNWEFFTQLQATLKRAYARNANEYSVMLLEGCTKVAEYSEQIDELNRQIEAILNLPSEPTKGQKEDMAGDMRRLIETIVNKHVFADSRQQYKQRTQAVSEFHKFTQLVPLLPAEALELKDLFGKLSKPEHDDDRNSYVNTDKAMFQTRYDRIKQIKSDIVARK
jgi:DNA repair exonuclease SbcCD ATPase subunit